MVKRYENEKFLLYLPIIVHYQQNEKELEDIEFIFYDIFNNNFYKFIEENQQIMNLDCIKDERHQLYVYVIY